MSALITKITTFFSAVMTMITGGSIGSGDTAVTVTGPVSYTHLDVYKRQDQSLSLNLHLTAERRKICCVKVDFRTEYAAPFGVT